uniref:nucleotidyltransferase family protein n=1 Tax=Ndongobacter massiliensis TaxID=1871025 RepID=UPI00093060A1|nr:nucleotidyltransferase family protein [Ndongobacter massiliensis]
MRIDAIVMASGQSKRMGMNKLFIEFRGKKLYEYTLDLMKALQKEALLDAVVVVSSYEEILEGARRRNLTALSNPNAEVGKSASIKLGVEACNTDAALMFFVADQPLLTKETCQALIESFREKGQMTFPCVGKRRGAPVIFPPEFREKLWNLTEDQGGMIFAKDHPTNPVSIADERELLDIDTHEAYTELKEEANE